MRDLHKTTQFKKDFKTAKRRSKDLKKLREVITMLQADELLPEKYKDHSLQGNWKPCRDCHIEPDWILIYDNSAPGELILISMGSHADLFK